MYPHANNALTDDLMIELVSAINHHKILPIEVGKNSEQRANIATWINSAPLAKNEYVTLNINKKRNKMHTSQQNPIRPTTFSECIGMLIEGHIPMDMRSYRNKIVALVSDDMIRTVNKHHRKLRTQLQLALSDNAARIPNHDDLLALAAIITRLNLVVIDDHGITHQEYTVPKELARGCALLRNTTDGIYHRLYTDIQALRSSDELRNTVLRENHKTMRMVDLRSYYERITKTVGSNTIKRADMISKIDTLMKKN